ncbi:MAG: sigma factor-like helix-turn-helix DNA-binding protein [Mycobacteriales bacterium]
MTPLTPIAAALHRAYETLPDGSREALSLARGGWTFAQIADRQGVPVERVRVGVLQAVLVLTQVRLALSA